MSVIPCNVVVKCDCDPNPFQNLSAELPDQDRFFAIANFEDFPPLGEGSWTQNSCRTVCYSTVSQADADQCALRLAQECTWGTWRKAPTRPNRLGDPIQIYANAPQSCTAFCSDGSPFFYTVGAGLFLALSQEQADHNAYGYACKQAEAHKICLSDINPSACLGTFYETVIAAFGEFLGDSNDWEIVSGALPPGLTFHGGVTPGIDVTIDGTPTVAGTYGFSVRVTAPDGDSVTRAYSITVANITSDVLPDGAIGVAYSYQFTQTGLSAPIWLLEVGTLPDGLMMDQNGLITGKPTTSGTSAFTVSATDTSSQCLKSFTITVGSAFWNLTWDAPTGDLGNAPGTESHTLSKAAFTVASTQPIRLVSNNFWDYRGSFVYTGPAVNCNLHLVVTAVSTHQFFFVKVQVDGNLILSVNVNQLNVTGTHDYPFVIPLSAGSLIEVLLETVLGSAVEATGVTWVGTLTST